MSLKSKIEAVIYASEEPVTLQQLVGLLGQEVEAELLALAARQAQLPLQGPGITAEMEMAPAAGPAPDEGGVHPGDSPAPERPDGAAGDGAIADTSVAPAAPPESDQEMAETNADEQAQAAEPAPDARAIRERERRVREHLRRTVDGLMREYAESDRGIEIREVAGGFRMGTKPEYHDAVRGFVRSLKPALKLTLQALETLAVVAYKQPVTAAEISEIRGVDSAGVLGGLMTRKLIATAGRKQVIGRPMLYKTTREFLVRFGLKDVQELPSMEEFERLAGELNEQEDLPMEATESIVERANARGDADHIRDVTGESVPPQEAPEPAALSDESPTATAAEPGGTADDEDSNRKNHASSTESKAADETR